MTQMNAESFNSEFDELVKTYRTKCLWFCRDSLAPQELSGRLRILEAIERYGDREAFIKTRKLRQWLLQNSSTTSVAS